MPTSRAKKREKTSPILKPKTMAQKIQDVSKVGKPHATTWVLKPASGKVVVKKRRVKRTGSIMENMAPEGFKPTSTTPTGLPEPAVLKPEQELMVIQPRKKSKKINPAINRIRRIAEGKELSTWNI